MKDKDLNKFKSKGGTRPSPPKMPLRYPERHFFKSYPILYPIFWGDFGLELE